MTATLTAVLVTPDGTIRTTELPTHPDHQFAELLDLLHCHAPAVTPLTPSLDLWFDGDTHRSTAPTNPTATLLADAFRHPGDHPYRGCVLLTARGDDTTAMRSLPTDLATHLTELTA